MKKIGFVGAGKMARALAGGILKRSSCGQDEQCHFVFSSRTEESGRAFLKMCQGLGGSAEWTPDNSTVMEVCSEVVLAAKPQQLRAILEGLPRDSPYDQLFLSLAAGITLGQLRTWLPKGARVVRSMPNLPAQIGLGASVYCAAPGLAPEDEAWVRWILSAGGKCWRVEEAQMDAVTALAGSGPAYLFHFLDALELAGKDLGLPAELARSLACQTVFGAAALASETGLPPLELANRVKSPNGTTIAGCAVLEENGSLRNLIAHCLLAAKNRAEAIRAETQ